MGLKLNPAVTKQVGSNPVSRQKKLAICRPKTAAHRSDETDHGPLNLQQAHIDALRLSNFLGEEEDFAEKALHVQTIWWSACEILREIEREKKRERLLHRSSL